MQKQNVNVTLKRTDTEGFKEPSPLPVLPTNAKSQKKNSSPPAYKISARNI